jgi:calcineurin-like phosphoesterase family protein
MTVYFTSDPHFGHQNVIKYCNRPFKTSQEMDEEMIARWNSKIQRDDTVYIIGDFAFHQPIPTGKILDRLNGSKILVYGNHDKGIKKHPELKAKFVKCVDYAEIYIDDQFIVMSHYAMLVWNKSHHGSWMLHGHSHGALKYPYEGKILDMGVDAHNFYPLSFAEVKKIMDTKNTQPVDHHA